MTALAATILRSNREPAIQSLLASIADVHRVTWQRSALMRGAEVGLLNAAMPGNAPEEPDPVLPGTVAPCRTCPGGRAGPGALREQVASPAVTDAVEDEPASRSGRNALEWIGIVAGALLVALIVKTFLIQAFFIPSLSMYSTLDKGDRVLVNKLSYHMHDIHRGDIVVFERPPGVPDNGIKDLIKRVVGLPGDTLESRDGHIYVNGKKLKEPYLDKGTTTVNLTRQTIPADHIFVMGDNRGNSEDSRVFGPIDEDLVVGRAFILVWPITEVHLL